MSGGDPWARLPEQAQALGVELGGATLDQLRRYAALLGEWNRFFNLTAIDDPVEVVAKHFLDSLSVSAAIDLTAVTRLIDVGSGAGFPGLVLKLAFPHLELVAIDSLQKRLKFVERVVGSLGVGGVALIHARAEDAAGVAWVGRPLRETGDLVTARAVARLHTLLEWTLPYARVGGSVVAMKGPDVDEEVREADAAIGLLGGGPPVVQRLSLPGTDIQRSLVIIPKVSPTSAAYPRRPGSARKHPL